MDVAILILNAGIPHDLETLFVMAWSIWYNRNQVVHDSQCETPSQVWGYAQRIQGDYKGVMTVSQLRKQPPEVSWAAPPLEVYRINVDGTTSVGRPIWCGSSKVMTGSYEAEITEALAVEESVLLARERGLHQIILETNSLVMAQAINTRLSHGELGTVIQRVLILLEFFSS